MNLDGFKHLSKHFSKCLNKVEILNLMGCNVTKDYVKVLSEAILGLTDPIKMLDLSHNTNMNLDGFKHLSKCLNKVEMLNLKFCDVKNDQVKVLSEAILGLTDPIKMLDLSHNNNMNLDGFKHLSKCLNKVEILHLDDCDVTNDQVKVLLEVILGLADPIKVLNLSWNKKMNLNGFKHLSKCLNKVEILYLMGCDVTNDQVKVLSDAILGLTDPIKGLYLSFNKKMNLDGFKHLSKCLNKVEILYLSYCDVTDDQVKVLSEVILGLTDPIKMLDLSHNKNMNLDGFKHLSKCLNKVEILHLNDCDVTNDQVKVLSEAILGLTDPIKKLDLSYNKKMNLDGFKHLSKCLNKVEMLSLMVCDVTNDQVKVLSEAILGLTDPMKKLYLVGNCLSEEEKKQFTAQCQQKVLELLA